MIKSTPLAVILGLLSLSGCAVVTVLDVKPSAETMAQALTQINTQVVQAQNDYENKELIWREVQKKPPENKAEVMVSGSQLLTLMSTDLRTLRQHQTELTSLHTEFQKSAGDSRQISENDARWPKVKLMRETFETTTQSFNANLRQYTDRSSQLSRLMGDHRLFAQIKPGDLVAKLNEAITPIAASEKKIGQELDAKELQYNEFRRRHGSSQPTRERALFLLIEEMSELRNQLQLKIRRIEQLRDDFVRQTQGRTFVRSFEPAWEQVEKIRTDHAMIRDEVEDLNEQYAKKAQIFGTSLKEGSEESSE